LVESGLAACPHKLHDVRERFAMHSSWALLDVLWLGSARRIADLDEARYHPAADLEEFRPSQSQRHWQRVASPAAEKNVGGFPSVKSSAEWGLIERQPHRTSNAVVAERCEFTAMIDTGGHEPAAPVPLVSILVPVYNEEAAVEPFVRAVLPVLEAEPIRCELLFVNDGSQDRTLELVLGVARQDDRIRIVNLSRNFGKEAALSAAIDHARGDALIPMDVDLQDPPELISQFLKHWREGYDVVYGVRVSRRSDRFLKRQSASWFYAVYNRLSPLPIPVNAGDFRLFDRRVADVIRRLPERTRFLKGLFAWVGFKSIGIPYERPARIDGYTKWSPWGLWNFALDGLLSFSTVPLRIWTYFGATIAAVAFIYGGVIVIRTLVMGVEMPGYASLFTAVLFLGGVQLLSIGIIGEYIGRMFLETKKRPLYVVESSYPAHHPPERPPHGP
jgi:glycosyltransferase involved in cell wall biosynthesis